MTGEDFRLADFFGCLAASAHEANIDRPALAEAAWLEAQIPASDLYEPGTEASGHAGVLITAVRGCGTGDPVDDNALWNALDAAGHAAIIAVNHEPADVQIALRGALAAADMLPEDWRDAIRSLLTPVLLAAAGVAS